ncbi:DUF2779 domain-containing protein [Salinibacter ruber]|uniref:DUF2779 domain-containing protein n=1 Tax=Salinibacter ruber TaxID=146919 RepID=UPI00216A28A9
MHVLDKAGLPLEGAEVMHLNPEYVHPNDGELFTRTDLTGELGEQIQEAREKAPEFTSILGRDEPPNLWPSRACNTCDCPEPCHSLPEHSVLTLPRLYYGHLDEIIEEGRWTLEEIQGHSHLKPKHENYIQAARSGEPYVDTSEVQSALNELEYPLYFLDFEAIDYALPPFEDTSPWKKIPFQYSLHVVVEGQEALRKEDVRHEEFLHDGDGDPRPPLAERLLEDIGSEGSIVVYNDTFEEGILEDLQEAFPQWGHQFQGFIDRLWDQGEIFQNGHYVHPSQKGSWSLKKVLPAFDPSLEYDDLDVQEGMEAVVEYSRMIAPETSESEAEEIEEDLLEYCARDTWAMVVIHKKLSELVGRDPTAPIA